MHEVTQDTGPALMLTRRSWQVSAVHKGLSNCEGPQGPILCLHTETAGPQGAIHARVLQLQAGSSCRDLAAMAMEPAAQEAFKQRPAAPPESVPQDEQKLLISGLCRIHMGSSLKS